MYLEVLAQLGFNGILFKLPSGYHAEVFRIETGASAEVLKVISKPELADSQLAHQLVADMALYAAELQRIGVRSPMIKTELLQSAQQRHLVITSPYCGVDVSKAIATAPLSHSLQIVSDILGLLRQFFLHPLMPKSLELQVGVDPKPANFTRDSENQLNFVDTMPPRARRDGQPIVEFPKPQSAEGCRVAYFRHFDMRGILIVLQTQLCRLRPHDRSKFCTLIRQFATEFHGNGLVTFLDQFVGTRFIQADRDSRIEIIDSLGTDDMYEMRDICAQLVEENPEVYDQEILERIFHLSHFFHDNPTPGNTTLAKKILISMTSQKSHRPFEWLKSDRTSCVPTSQLVSLEENSQ